MEEVICPECGANAEGLVHHCDCCGALLNPKQTLFFRMVYCTGAFFDIDIYLNQIFDKLDNISPEPYADVLQRIEFDFWCYPIRKRTGVSYYASRKQAIITIEVDTYEYISGTQKEKLALLTREVKEKIDMLHQRVLKKKIHIGDLFSQIDEALK